MNMVRRSSIVSQVGCKFARRLHRLGIEANRSALRGCVCALAHLRQQGMQPYRLRDYPADVRGRKLCPADLSLATLSSLGCDPAKPGRSSDPLRRGVPRWLSRLPVCSTYRTGEGGRLRIPGQRIVALWNAARLASGLLSIINKELEAQP